MNKFLVYISIFLFLNFFSKLSYAQDLIFCDDLKSPLINQKCSKVINFSAKAELDLSAEKIETQTITAPVGWFITDFAPLIDTHKKGIISDPKITKTNFSQISNNFTNNINDLNKQLRYVQTGLKDYFIAGVKTPEIVEIINKINKNLDNNANYIKTFQMNKELTNEAKIEIKIKSKCKHKVALGAVCLNKDQGHLEAKMNVTMVYLGDSEQLILISKQIITEASAILKNLDNQK